MAFIDQIASGLLFAGGALRDRSFSFLPGRPGVATMVGGGEGVVDDLEDGQTISYAAAIADHPALWAVYHKLVRELSTLGLGVYRRQRDEHGAVTGRLTRVHGTSLEQVLHEPAPGLGLVDLLQWTFGPCFAEGNALIGKYRGNGSAAPTGLLPLDWRYMSAFARPGGPVEAWLSSHLGFGEPRELKLSEVVHTAWRAPSAGAVGVSPLRPLLRTVRLEDAARRFLRAHLRNGARPAGALMTEEKLDGAKRTALRTEVNRTHGGVDNAFRIAILGDGLKWQPLSFSAADAQLDESRLRSREEMCVVYDVRWSQISDPAAGGSVLDAGALARDLHRTLRPWALMASSAWQRQLVDTEPEWRDDDLVIRFDFRELLRGSPQEEANRATHLYVNGVTALDETRDDLGLPPTGREEDKLPRTPYAQLEPGDPGAPDARRNPPSADPESARYRLDRGPQGT